MHHIYFRNNVLLLAGEDEAPENAPDQTYRYSSVRDISQIISMLKASNERQSILIKHTDEQALFHDFSSWFELRYAAGGLVHNKEHRFLIIKRFDMWDLPKGHMEKNETARETAVREVSEECGIAFPRIGHALTTTYHHYILHNKDILKVTYWFRMYYDGDDVPEPQTEEDITEVQWVTAKTLDQLKTKTYPSLRYLFALPLWEAGD